MTDHETHDAPVPQPAPGATPPAMDAAAIESTPGAPATSGTESDEAHRRVVPARPAPVPASAASAFLAGTRLAASAGPDARPGPWPEAMASTTATVADDAVGQAAPGAAAGAAAGAVGAALAENWQGSRGAEDREEYSEERDEASAARGEAPAERDEASAAHSEAAATTPPAEPSAGTGVAVVAAGRDVPATAPEPALRRRRLALVGFGSVGRALVRLLESVRGELAARHGVAFDVTLLATRGSGVVIDPLGIPPSALETLAGIAEQTGTLPRIMAGRHVYQTPKGMRARGPFRDAGSLPAILAAPETPYDVLLELSTVSPADGRPAADHLRAALGSGRDAVSANKAPLAWYGGELMALAGAHGGHLRHEATTMDCLPVHAVRDTLVPVGRIERFAGVVNSTTNIVLSTMAAGGTAEDGMAEARRLGIAEADATTDTSGLDAALKATILANLLLEPDVSLTPDAVDCSGIEDVPLGWPGEAAARGARVRLVARGEVIPEDEGVAEDHSVSAPAPRARSVRVSVRPEELPLDDPLAGVNGASMALTIETEHAGRLTLTLTEPHVPQTAYALLMDLLAINRARG